MKRIFAGCSVALAFAVLATPSQAQDLSLTLDPAPHVEYLEIVTTEVDKTIATLSEHHGVAFSEPVAELGFGRVASLAGGGRISVRAPIGDQETPVVRPYLLVDDIEQAIATAEAAGAQFAMYATEIPEQGTFAIYFLGGIQHGLWQR
ncbi:MAG: hydroxylase [Pseudomonadota bacterium]